MNYAAAKDKSESLNGEVQSLSRQVHIQFKSMFGIYMGCWGLFYIVSQLPQCMGCINCVCLWCVCLTDECLWLSHVILTLV